MKKIILILALYSNFIFAGSASAEGAGLKINLNSTKISIIYNDNVEDKIVGMDYIRDPSELLFELIYLLNKNKKNILKFKKNIKISIDNDKGDIWVYQKENPSKVLLDIRNSKKIDGEILIKSICKGLDINKCKIEKNVKTSIYLTDIAVTAQQSDLIEFGCFPCKNNRTITLTERYENNSSRGRVPKFKKVVISKKTICKYFNKIRD